MSSVAENRPRFSAGDAERLAQELFGFRGRAAELASERDRNFRLTEPGGREHVLKIASAADSREVLHLQNLAMQRVSGLMGPGCCPLPVPAPGGEVILSVQGHGGLSHFVRLVSWVPGRFLAQVRPQAPSLLASLGAFMAELDRALRGLEHPAAERDLAWNMSLAGGVIRRHLGQVRGSGRRRLVEAALERFERSVLPLSASLRSSVIHNDANDWNVLVRASGAEGADPWDLRVGGIIDFGDMLKCWTVCDLAIAAAYAMLGKTDPLAAVARVTAGYHSVIALDDAEFEVLLPLLGARLATSVCLSAHQQAAEPDNRYLSVSEEQAWGTLGQVSAIDPGFAAAAFRAACGLEPSGRASRVASWIRSHAGGAAAVVNADLNPPAAAVIDLSAASPALDDPSVLFDPAAFGRWVDRRIREAGAGVGIGRYDEARLAYAGGQFVVPRDGTRETRTVHIGVDLFLEPGTPVFAPLDGRIHSFRNNALPFDYGPTIILEHETGGEEGTFFTLYGHLSLDSLDGLERGLEVARGQQIARVGDADVNGGWPPHLHFQVITDMFGREGDFPGVAPPSDRSLWLSLCPDPGPLLGIRDAAAPRPPGAGVILDARRSRIGRSLSISYRRPLHIVRGYMQWLYNADGLAWLDAVNNVPHVGHSHPRVVQALSRQAAILNTNTRYLHENLVRFAERICRTLPEPLRVCYFVNSGSEANDLALRLARTHTGRKDVVVLEGAYHGNLTSLIEISPYKFDGPGGSGAAPHVHKVPVPDPYRGRYRRGEADLAGCYAAHVNEALRDAGGRGGAAAFICESIPSCAGQVVLPHGYLRNAYSMARAAGAVCIADEVQTGFGRVGSHFWAFGMQGVVPDIVTMGKPIGNGHPLGAVVTTPEIAASFANGMEYFNTYGGNPVSCAVGMAVLDVIEEQQLQRKALETGERFRAGLEELMVRHTVIGDVRGAGLFLGVELVADRDSREPAGPPAAYVAERMRDLGILVGTDGPWHNVLKIKPPMVFDAGDADRFVEALDTILGEDFARPADS